MTNHPRLHRRSGSRNYYFRAKVPTDLVEHFDGKREVCFSLRTDSFKEATQKARIESVKFDQEINEIRRKVESLQQAQEQARETGTAAPTSLDEAPFSTTITDIEVDRLCASMLHHVLSADEEGRMLGMDDWEYERIERELAEFEQEHRPALARGRIEMVEDLVDEWLNHGHYDLDKDGEEYRKVAFAVLKTLVQSQRMRAERHRGEIVDTPPAINPAVEKDEAVMMTGTPSQNATPSDQTTYAVSTGLKLSEVFQRWVDERQPVEGTRRDFEVQVNRFIDLHGDLPVDTITKAHVREFKDAMIRCPSRLPHKLRGVSLPKLVQWAEKNPDHPRLTARTINDKSLAALRSILSYADQNGYRDGNPASGIKMVAGKVQTTTRLPYSVEDMNVLFRSEVFVNPDYRPKGGAGEAAKWIPLLAAFTGARLEELGQLRVTDVAQERGIWFLDLTTIDEDRRLKTESSRRRVPIHNTLVKLGFLDYVKKRRNAKDTLLFPKLKPTGDKLTHSFSQWYGRYARKIGIDDKRKVFHSFRHTVKDAFREAGVGATMRDALMGHASKTEGERYGSGYSLKRLDEAMQKLKYEGLYLGHLMR